MPLKNLNPRIQAFYDASSALWEEVWGQHMHHGYYGANGKFHRDHRQAQIDMIEQMLIWGGINGTIGHVIDVGCGIGGSAIYLAAKFDCTVIGITLSPFQARRALARSREENPDRSVRFMVADALFPPFERESFDLVWALESAEHFPDKRKFLGGCFELLKPGGRLLMATWCHREVPPHLTSAERDFLKLLYHAYQLPPMIPIQEYGVMAREIGFTNVSSADWSQAVQPFWGAVLRSALLPRNLLRLIGAGWLVFKGALAIPLMMHGYKSGLIRFGLLKGTKPPRGRRP